MQRVLPFFLLMSLIMACGDEESNTGNTQQEIGVQSFTSQERDSETGLFLPLGTKEEAAIAALPTITPIPDPTATPIPAATPTPTAATVDSVEECTKQIVAPIFQRLRELNCIEQRMNQLEGKELSLDERIEVLEMKLRRLELQPPPETSLGLSTRQLEQRISDLEIRQQFKGR